MRRWGEEERPVLESSELKDEPWEQVAPFCPRRDFDATVYVGHEVVERCVNRLKQWRSIATRYKNRAYNYLSAAVLVIWLSA